MGRERCTPRPIRPGWHEGISCESSFSISASSPCGDTARRGGVSTPLRRARRRKPLIQETLTWREAIVVQGGSLFRRPRFSLREAWNENSGCVYLGRDIRIRLCLISLSFSCTGRSRGRRCPRRRASRSWRFPPRCCNGARFSACPTRDRCRASTAIAVSSASRTPIINSVRDA